MDISLQSGANRQYSAIKIDNGTFYPDLLQLDFGDRICKLELRASRLLEYLACSPGQPHTRDSLIQNVWTNSFVGDEVLTNAITKIRRAFDDDSQDPRIIETIPKVGYRLIASIDYISDSEPAEVSTPQTTPPPVSVKKLFNKKKRLTVIAIALVAVVAYLGLVIKDPQNPAGMDSARTSPITAQSTEIETPGSSQKIAGSENLPVSEFRDCNYCPVMVTIPPGDFLMGLEGEPADADEGPVHRVQIEYPFALSKFELTFGQWNACVDGGGCSAYRPDDEGWGSGQRPVINVSWFDAKAYVNWIRDRTGKNYRLPTEAEWEYAARAGSPNLYPWGHTIDAGKANYGNFRAKTVVVGLHDSNNFALHDMVGNVWEWVEDCYSANAYSSHRHYPAAFPGDPANCRHPLRGGAWDVDTSDGVHLLRLSVREKALPNGRYSNFGIRVARDL
ncbi:MAG: SUMF1/EgtB/PvdO family nonheme iron enzyme [Gammaproteobacteria bacterium]|nr:SUMF1/EgtB/PvdO family nonheme iron enzyme [Gammaproteobacteria bacterium]